MVQGFLLDRIDTKPAAPAIGGQHHSIARPLTHKTKTALTFVQFAKARTQPALNAPVGEHHPPAARKIRLRQLCDHLFKRSYNVILSEAKNLLSVPNPITYRSTQRCFASLNLTAPFMR